MRHVSTLLRRELAAYFLSPMAYIILLGFQIIAWVDFWRLVSMLGDPRFMNEYSNLRDPMNLYISGSTEFWFAILIAVPALTMRLIAEERRTGTIEGLLTVPVTETEIVISKWLAGVVMYLVLLLPFAIYLPFLRTFGKYDFDPGPLTSLGLGLTTIGMMFVAIGLFFSALSRHQIVAAIWTFVTLFVIVLMTLFFYNVAMDQRSPWTALIGFVSVVVQSHGFGAGELDLRFLVMHLSVAAVMLYLSVKILEFRRGK